MYTAEQLRQRDASAWTKVQAILAPLQFIAFIADRTSDRVHPVFETIHVLSLIITVLVTIVAFPPRRRQ